MRAAALTFVFLLSLACSAKKTEQKQDADEPAKTEVKPAPKKLGRGHPPQSFVDADTTGQILANNAKSIFWVERRAAGHFVVGGHKAGGDRFDVAGPVAPIRALVADEEHVYFAASPLTGTKDAGKPRGVFTAPVSGDGTLTQLGKEQGVLAVGPEHLYILHRGTTTTPGRIERVAKKTRAVDTLFQGQKNFGRADLVGLNSGVVWLGDRREEREGLKVRLGTLQYLPSDAKMPHLLANAIVSPGPHLRVHANFAYFTARDEANERRRLYRVSLDPKASSKPEALLGTSWEIARFAVDDTGIYALAEWQGWTVLHFPHGAGDPRVLSSPLTKVISPLLLDTRYVYWGTSGTIHRTPKTPIESKKGKGSYER